MILVQFLALTFAISLVGFGFIYFMVCVDGNYATELEAAAKETNPIATPTNTAMAQRSSTFFAILASLFRRRLWRF